MVQLLQLPAEVLDVVIDHIYAPIDLVSLASTCKSLWRLVQPDHLEWRSIDILFEDAPFLAKLLRNERQALLVQRLRIHSFPGPDDPSGFRCVRRMVQQEQTVESLLQGLSDLAESLRCVRTVELTVGALDFMLLGEFLRRLRNASSAFTNLSVEASFVIGGAHEGQLPEIQSVISTIKGLTHFSWWSDDYYHNPILMAVEEQIMKHCPTLQHIELYSSFDPRILDDFPPPASTQLWQGTWPDLRRLQVKRLGVSTDTGTFLQRHSKIETLQLEANYYPWDEVVFELAQDSLPNLRQVWWSFKQDTNSLLTLLRPLPDGSRRPIEILSEVGITTFDNRDPTISTYQADSFMSDAQFEEVCVHISQMPLLRVLGLENKRSSGIPKLAQLASMAPSVEEVMLWLGGWPGEPSMVALAEAVGNFASLRSLHIMGVEPWIEQEWIQTAILFAQYCPNLEHFSGFDLRGNDWFRTTPVTCTICNHDWPLQLEDR